jgi:cytidylate kinase
MTARVVCISRTIGAGGEAVGKLVADRLGYRYVDEEIVALAAERGGVDAADVADAEERKSLVSRLLSGLAHAAPDADLARIRSAPEKHRELIRTVVEEVAVDGQAVIVAHAASHALAGRDGVLRVFVTASPDVRVQRLEATGTGDDSDASRAVREADAARADYLRRFYGVDRELPEQYDLVINLDVLTPEDAAGVIARAAEPPGSEA